MNKNILMVCYYYPPLTDVGCKRSVAFSKYFKKHGWNPYVLTVKNPDRTYCSLGSDKPPAGVAVERAYSIVNLYRCLGKMNGLLSRIFRLFGIEIKRNYFYDIFCIPDYFWGWIPHSILRGYRIIRKYNVDIIYVSCTPFSSGITGIILKKITKKSLVLDFRDVFGLEVKGLEKFSVPPHFRKKINQWIANKILDNADIFIVVTEEMKELYIQHYPQIQNRIFTIHNGFDTDFSISRMQRAKYPKFTVTYAGEFYFYALGSEVFFEGLNILKKQGRITKDNFQFLFYGDGKNEIAQRAKKYAIEDLVEANSRIPYQEMINVIAQSHLQLLRVVNLAVPTKISDGIAMNVPFLATVPHGEAENIIRRYSSSSYIVSDDSPEKVAEAILDAMARYEKNEIQDNYVEEFLAKFSRENLTLELMRTITGNLNTERLKN